MNAPQQPWAYRAANDRAPRERRPLVERFAERVAQTMELLYLAAGAALIIALWFDAIDAAWLFLGSMLSAGMTQIIVWLFLRRLQP